MNTAKLILSRNHAAPIANLLLRNYAFKSDLKIKWVRPEKIPSYKAEKSGDKEEMPKINIREYLPEFKNSKELQTADETVRKLFSLEFAPKKFTNRYYFKEMVEKVKRHDYDVGSIEVKIARWTGVIRALQDIMERYPRNIRLKVRLTELIDKRKKHLKYLRRWDYKRFEWLLETLNIVYKPAPEGYERVTRKGSLRKLTDQYCDGLKEDRLMQYKLQLESEQPAFLEEKLRSLQFIRDEEKDCGVPVSVTDEEIDEVKRQLEHMKRKLDTIEE